MRTVIVASTRPHTGKTGVALALVGMLERRGVACAYVKPFGTMPTRIDGFVCDRDAAWVNAEVPHPGPLPSVCPITVTPVLIESVLAGEGPDTWGALDASIAQLGAGHDAVVAEGPADMSEGASVGLDTALLAERLDACVVLVDRPSHGALPDEIVAAKRMLGPRLCGAILNLVPTAEEASVREHLVPFVERTGVPVFGVLPLEPALASVSVEDIVEALGGVVLTAEDHLGDLVETFMVGAMGQEKALRFFRRKSGKAVVTGGDRADVQLAALETNTRALILTGNLPPSSIVLSRAEELGVPMILVETDTLGAVERMEALMDHTRLHDPVKAARIREMFDAGIEAERLLSALGLG